MRFNEINEIRWNSMKPIEIQWNRLTYEINRNSSEWHEIWNHSTFNEILYMFNKIIWNFIESIKKLWNHEKIKNPQKFHGINECLNLSKFWRINLNSMEFSPGVSNEVDGTVLISKKMYWNLNQISSLSIQIPWHLTDSIK